MTCPSCMRPTKAVEGLCPLCGAVLPRPEEGAALADVTDPDAPALPDVTDPDAPALPDVTDPDGRALPDVTDADGEALFDAPDTDPGATIPPQILTHEDTGPAAAPAHVPDAREKEAPPRRRLPRLPWDRIIVLLLYLVVGGALLLYEHNASDGARIEGHLRAADRLLGERAGAGATVEQLVEAADHYLQALALDLQIDLAHRRLDLIKRRLDERRTALPEDMERRHAALSARAQMERAQARRGFWSSLPITPSERFGLRDHQKRMQRNRYLYFGGFTILVGWMLLRGGWRNLSGRETNRPREDEGGPTFRS